MGVTVKLFDDVDHHLCPTLKGEAIFAARVVKSLARSYRYVLRTFPNGSKKIALVTCHNISEARL